MNTQPTDKKNLENQANRLVALGFLLLQQEKELSEVPLGTLRNCPKAYFTRWVLKMLIEKNVFQDSGKEILTESLKDKVWDQYALDALSDEYQTLERDLTSLLDRIKQMREKTLQKLSKKLESK